MTIKIFGYEGVKLFNLKQVGTFDAAERPLVGDIVITKDEGDASVAYRVIAIVHHAPLEELQVIGRSIRELSAS